MPDSEKFHLDRTFELDGRMTSRPADLSDPDTLRELLADEALPAVTRRHLDQRLQAIERKATRDAARSERWDTASDEERKQMLPSRDF